jgi:hypothetical protein
MTEYDEEWVFPICVAFASVIVGGVMFIEAVTLDYKLKTNNYQTSLKMITECRVRAKSSADDTCGKIPTWEQYK